MNNFIVTKKSNKNQARAGVLITKSGKIQTPFFMPIATRGSVRSVDAAEIKKIGAQIILSNSYHLYLKPGLRVIRKAGGLHRFMNWPGPILTDSGGFQVFSLSGESRTTFASAKVVRDESAGRPGALVKVSDQGVEFKSVYDGSKHLFTPRLVITMQEIFGSDIMMVLDQCVANPCSHKKAETAMQRTLKWAEQSKNSPKSKKSLLFGIVQGSLYRDLRLKCAQALVKMKFDGYAIGGLAVGEDPKEMCRVLDYTVPVLPQDKPRYLMGVGLPEQIIAAVKRGIDMFDCVIPTREARHGRLYIQNAKLRTLGHGFYSTVNIKLKKFAQDVSPINPYSKLPQLRGYSKAYLRHLFSVNETLALKLATLNNLEFYQNLMQSIRRAIKNNLI